MVLRPGARVAIIGAGPSGLVTAKHAIDAGFDVSVFEASDGIGGQWNPDSGHSGVWPGMVTNTSRTMTAFSDLPGPPDWPLHPSAEQIRDYLHAYARRFGLLGAIRLDTPVRSVISGWRVDGEAFDAVVAASGRFRKPRLPAGLAGFRGELLHAFDYPGAPQLRAMRTLVYGNGISGHEIASDLACFDPVVSAYRKPRYVLRKVVAGVPSDWQWYTQFGALQRQKLPRDVFGELLRSRVLEVAGDPSAFGAPRPDRDILTAGMSLCQDYLEQVAAGRIRCRPQIVSIDGREVRFSDGSGETVDAIVCATGYDLDIPYLPEDVWAALGPDLDRLYLRTVHPDLPGFGAVGQFLAQGPYFPLLELQARWIVAIWTGAAPTDGGGRWRAATAVPSPVLNPHNVLAAAIAEELGVTPDPHAWPELAESLLFGPMLPSRYRLNGPGATAEAPQLYREQLASSPRARVDPADVAQLPALGLAGIAELPFARR